MLRSYLRDEIDLLLRKEILSHDEVLASAGDGPQASFVDRAPVPGGARQVTNGSPANHAAIALEVEV